MLSDDFPSLGLSPAVLKAVKQLGYEQPSPIQAQSIPILLQKKNLLGMAQTGTGKTAAFALPFLSQIDKKQKSLQILVLTPTRELAIQVAEAFQTYARHINEFRVLPIYGGTDIGAQLRGLKRGVHAVVGTPGRILDHLRRQSLDLSTIKGLILDEADEMLRMGFIEDVETILSQTPAQCQRALFSATMPNQIRNISKKYLGDAEHISIKSTTKTVKQVDQKYITVKSHQKMDALTRVLEAETFDGMIIFVRTKSSTIDISERLEARGFCSAAMNGDLSQALRERTINRLKKGQIDIVVATDVAARGLDVERISHVINFDIPYGNESYIHRIGRTGRAGRQGKAILFITPKETRLLRSIEKSIRQSISPLTMPTSQQVSAHRIRQFTDQLMNTLESSRLDKFRDLITQFASKNELDLADIAAALAYENQKDRPLFPKLDSIIALREKDQKPVKNKMGNRKITKRKERVKSSAPSAKEKDSTIRMVTYRLELGQKDSIKPSHITSAIVTEAGITSRHIGEIKIYNNFSTIDLPEGMPNALLKHLKKAKLFAKPMRLSIYNPQSRSNDRALTKSKLHTRKKNLKAKHSRDRNRIKLKTTKLAANKTLSSGD